MLNRTTSQPARRTHLVLPLIMGLTVGSFAVGCQRAPGAPLDTQSTEGAAVPPAEANPGPTAEALPPTQRIVAIGDVHGDLGSAREALQLGGAVNEEGAWIGGDLIVVQVGDQTDRGDDEREILDWFEELERQAEAAGGAFHALLGNHEVMNVQLDLRYVTDGGFEDFADIPPPAGDKRFDDVPPDVRGRIAAFLPGGPYATMLADHPVALQLGTTVFVHGGITPEFAEIGIEAINASVEAWMRGHGPEPAAVQGDESPIWSRHYSHDAGPEACAMLDEALGHLGAERMVVAHTVQSEGINSACDGRVWRIDVGLADYYGGETQVLEILGDQVRVVGEAR